MANESCKICDKPGGKYMCPRCNILYCSVQCYKSPVHIECSESFYRDNVFRNMRCAEQNPQLRKNMFDILERIQRSHETPLEDSDLLDSDDEEETPDLSERLQNVDLDDADLVWQKLTTAERKEFENLVQSGDISQLVCPWEPWWLFKVEKKLVEEASSEAETTKNYVQNCPKVKTYVPPLHQVEKCSPPPFVKYSILNVLAGYSCVTRYFNGEHHTNPVEASATLINICGNALFEYTEYESATAAIEAALCQVLDSLWLEDTVEIAVEMKKDVECILTGPESSNCTFYLLAALSDIHSLLWEALETFSKVGRKSAAKGGFSKKFAHHLPPSVEEEEVKHCHRKLQYYLSWSEDYAHELCNVLLLQKIRS